MKEREEQSQEKWRPLKERQKTERGQWRGLMAFDGCDFSQVPKGPKEKMASCLTAALSGVVCVCVCVFLLQCALAWCLSTNSSLHCTFR